MLQFFKIRKILKMLNIDNQYLAFLFCNYQNNFLSLHYHQEVHKHYQPADKRRW